MGPLTTGRAQESANVRAACPHLNASLPAPVSRDLQEVPSIGANPLGLVPGPRTSGSAADRGPLGMLEVLPEVVGMTVMTTGPAAAPKTASTGWIALIGFSFLAFIVGAAVQMGLMMAMDSLYGACVQSMGPCPQGSQYTVWQPPS